MLQAQIKKATNYTIVNSKVSPEDGNPEIKLIGGSIQKTQISL